MEAPVAGFDSVVFDSSSKPFDENVSETKSVVEAVRLLQDSHRRGSLQGAPVVKAKVVATEKHTGVKTTVE